MGVVVQADEIGEENRREHQRRYDERQRQGAN